MSEKPGQMNAVTLPDGWCQVKTSFYNELLTSQGEMLEALTRLTMLIRNMRDIYNADAASWLIQRVPFKLAEKAIQKAKGAQ